MHNTGVINPAFVDTPEGVNIDTSPSWSDDTSSDNMKDQNSSRASTLTRTIQESAEAEQEEQFQKRFSMPLNDTRDGPKDSTM